MTEQNGVAECMNTTLVETVGSMLSDAKLPHKFWGEALSTVAYLQNRSLTKAMKRMTPYEAWTGEKPLVDHLRAFAYAQIPKDERKTKPKVTEVHLFGLWHSHKELSTV